MSWYTKHKKSKHPASYSRVERERRDKGLCIKCGDAPEPQRRFCKPCLNRASQRYHARHANLSPINKILARWHNIGNVKKAQGKLWKITPDDLTWPTHCPALGIELDYTGKDLARGWSIDKLNPALGYVPGNVAIISRLANTIKSNATSTQIRQVADWLDTQTFLQD